MSSQHNIAEVVIADGARQRKSSLGGAGAMMAHNVADKMRDVSGAGLKLAKKGFNKSLTIGVAFKEFLIRGNMIDLVVAVVVGGAFTALINAVVADIITPTIAAIFGQPDFSAIKFQINHSEFKIGHLLNAMLSFLIVSLFMFFCVVLPLERVLRVVYAGRYDTKKCEFCCEKVPAAAKRCKFCTSDFPEAADIAAKVTL